jgi:hypothetical protein
MGALAEVRDLALQQTRTEAEGQHGKAGLPPFTLLPGEKR